MGEVIHTSISARMRWVNWSCDVTMARGGEKREPRRPRRSWGAGEHESMGAGVPGCVGAKRRGIAVAIHPNGLDVSARRLSFSCFKHCVRSKDPAILELYRNCPHRANRLGFSTHVSIAQHPRLILEIPEALNAIVNCMPSVPHPREPTARSRRTTPSCGSPRSRQSAARPLYPRWVSLPH